MKRKLMQKLVNWKASSGRKPLILKGVRQTGKTYLLEKFGREHFSNWHIINFEKQENACALFEQDLVPKRIIDELRFLLEKPIDINNDLIIFDEIQACPKALTSLKYFCEDMPELALCSAGSLLGLHLGNGSYPVGKVDMMHLYPMSFSEFLFGIGDDLLAEYLLKLDLNEAISEPIHNRLWVRLKQYFITGGLPEVVAIFSTQQDNLYEGVIEVRKKQTELIHGYYADIAKHSGKINALHIDRTWRAVPTQLSLTQDSNVRRFKFRGVIEGVNRYSQLARVIDWLKASELVIKVPLIETVRDPLLAYAKDNIFRLFMFDVGILGAMSNLEPKDILAYDYGSYKGYFAENYVAQQLQAHLDVPMFSWQEGRSEVEFILKHNGNIFPIEVKSGKVVHAKSLHKFIEKYNSKKSFVLSAQNISVDDDATRFNLPLYCVERIWDV